MQKLCNYKEQQQQQHYSSWKLHPKMSFIERYLDTVETLPSDLHRSFSMIRELDGQAESKSRKLETVCKSFLEEMQLLSADERKERLRQIQESFRAAHEIANEKVSLAVQTYDTVDKHIRELDRELDQFESEHSSGSTDNRFQKRGRSKDLASETDRLEDMPVDPNEPTYCLCHQVSYGEMIACDNESCPTEWFHFACVNLTEKPKSKWFCPRCSALTAGDNNTS
eukprot:m.74842 g.74842  ORF g.74842 m.74842 type:complete len:225 (-) comp24703_c0_seq1:525-1199(-)